MNIQKLILSLIFLVLGAVLVILFWRNLLLLSLLIILLAIAKHHFLPIKRELSDTDYHEYSTLVTISLGNKWNCVHIPLFSPR